MSPDPRFAGECQPKNPLRMHPHERLDNRPIHGISWGIMGYYGSQWTREVKRRLIAGNPELFSNPRQDRKDRCQEFGPTSTGTRLAGQCGGTLFYLCSFCGFLARTSKSGAWGRLPVPYQSAARQEIKPDGL